MKGKALTLVYDIVEDDDDDDDDEDDAPGTGEAKDITPRLVDVPM